MADGMDESRPIFVQIAELIENSIIDGELAEGAQVPSTNELAAFHRINPATAAKGVNQLVTDGVLHKRRGIGMFVTEGSRERLRERRRARFAAARMPAISRVQHAHEAFWAEIGEFREMADHNVKPSLEGTLIRDRDRRR